MRPTLCLKGLHNHVVAGWRLLHGSGPDWGQMLWVMRPQDRATALLGCPWHVVIVVPRLVGCL